MHFISGCPSFPRETKTFCDSGVKKEELNMANQVGKKYTCEKCGATYIVTKGGKGILICCGKPMEIKK